MTLNQKINLKSAIEIKLKKAKIWEREDWLLVKFNKTDFVFYFKLFFGKSPLNFIDKRLYK